MHYYRNTSYHVFPQIFIPFSAHEFPKGTCLIKHLFILFIYRDPNAEDKMNPFAEQEAWEEHQIGKYFCIIIL